VQAGKPKVFLEMKYFVDGNVDIAVKFNSVRNYLVSQTCMFHVKHLYERRSGLAADTSR
jgi:hypothetical protein